MTEVRTSAHIDGLLLVEPTVHEDDRGRFVETYRRSWFPGHNEMVQSNRAERNARSIVGLHYHLRQADYWYVGSGRARVVLHDLRSDSPTGGATLHLDLGPGVEPAQQVGIYIPPGVAHGFAAVTDVVLSYLVDAYYDPTDELGLAWDDPVVGATWTIEAPILSARDRANPRRSQIEADQLPTVAGS